MFCLGLPEVTGLCSVGYYCDRGAIRDDPVDGVTGNVCPAGRYCGMSTLKMHMEVFVYLVQYHT